jgi:hypothetical protein
MFFGEILPGPQHGNLLLINFGQNLLQRLDFLAPRKLCVHDEFRSEAVTKGSRQDGSSIDRPFSFCVGGSTLVNRP